MEVGGHVSSIQRVFLDGFIGLLENTPSDWAVVSGEGVVSVGGVDFARGRVLLARAVPADINRPDTDRNER